MVRYKAYSYKKGGNNNTNRIRNIVNRVNLNPVNFGYLSTDDQLKGNNTTFMMNKCEPRTLCNILIKHFKFKFGTSYTQFKPILMVSY